MVNLYIALERNLEGLDPNSSDHVWCAMYSDRLDEVASESGTRKLSSFLSYKADEVADYLDDFEMGELPMPPVEWFDPREVSAVADTLVKSLESNQTPFMRSKLEGRLGELIAELQHIQTVAEAAATAKTRMRLWIGE